MFPCTYIMTLIGWFDFGCLRLYDLSSFDPIVWSFVCFVLFCVLKEQSLRARPKNEKKGRCFSGFALRLLDFDLGFWFTSHPILAIWSNEIRIKRVEFTRWSLDSMEVVIQSMTTMVLICREACGSCIWFRGSIIIDLKIIWGSQGC